MRRYGPPPSPTEAINPHGLWGAAARGVAIRLCEGAPDKGLGAFAMRTFARGELAGVYMGERLTQRQYALRHGWSGERADEVASAQPQAEEVTWLSERAERLGRLSADEGAPMGGVANGGKYIFPLMPGNWQQVGSALLPSSSTFHSIPAYLDAEDPTRSSWCRYINHSDDAASCNLKFQVDGAASLVWFVTTRDVAEGEELAFSYDDNRSVGGDGEAVPWFSQITLEDLV